MACNGPDAREPLEIVAGRIRFQLLNEVQRLARLEAEVRALAPALSRKLAAYDSMLAAWRQLHALGLACPCGDRFALPREMDPIPF